MTTVEISTMSGYQAALESAAHLLIPNIGYLRISGPDRIDFLQRQTTNDMELLKGDVVLGNVFTSPSARILDVCQMIGDDMVIGLITLPGRGEDTTNYLKSKIFFMDQVKIENASDEKAMIVVEGKKANEALIDMELDVPTIGQHKTTALDGNQIRVISLRGYSGKVSFLIMLPQEALSSFTEVINQLGLTAMDQQSYETLRIEAGIAGTRNELNEKYTPFEMNLDELVSGEKGCYTGQEVLARQITYDKVTKRLVQIRLEAAVSVGSSVMAGDRRIGEVTSFCMSPRFGPLALAVLKKPYFEEGGEVGVKVGDKRVLGMVNGGVNKEI